MGSLTPWLLDTRPPFMKEPVASTNWSAIISWSGKFFASILSTLFPFIFPFFTMLPSRKVPPFLMKSLRNFDNRCVPVTLGGKVGTNFTGILSWLAIFEADSSPSSPNTAGIITASTSRACERTLRANSLTMPSFCMSFATAVERITCWLLLSLSIAPSLTSHTWQSTPMLVIALATKGDGKSRKPCRFTSATLSHGSEVLLVEVT